MANHSIPQIKLKRIRAGYYLTHYNYKSYYIEHMGNGDWTWSQFDAAPDDIHRTKKDAVIALRHYLATQPPPRPKAPRRMYSRIRTDSLELTIAWYRSTRNYDAEAAIVDLARSIGAPVREDVIAQTVADYRRFDAERNVKS